MYVNREYTPDKPLLIFALMKQKSVRCRRKINTIHVFTLNSTVYKSELYSIYVLFRSFTCHTPVLTRMLNVLHVLKSKIIHTEKGETTILYGWTIVRGGARGVARFYYHCEIFLYLVKLPAFINYVTNISLLFFIRGP